MAPQKRQRTTQELEPHEVNRLKWEWKACADAQITRTRPGGYFTLDADNRPVAEGLFWWFFDDPRSRYDLRRGILIKGGTGTGKTTMVNAFRDFHLRHGGNLLFESAATIALEYARTGQVDRWLAPRLVAIDEIGCEKVMRHYGNELNVIAYVLHERYALWQRRGIPTLATTNLDSDEMEQAYGPSYATACARCSPTWCSTAPAADNPHQPFSTRIIRIVRTYTDFFRHERTYHVSTRRKFCTYAEQIPHVRRQKGIRTEFGKSV